MSETKYFTNLGVAPRGDTAGSAAILAQWRTQPRTALLWTCYLALAAVLALPVLLIEVPLSSDILNHLARIHVWAHIGSDPDLARFFQFRDVLVPYMGLDWLLTPLARVLPTLVVGRIALVMLLWGTVGAVMVLQRVFNGRVGFEPLLMGLVSYNSVLAWGFLNYALGVIGALLGLAAWHGMRRRPLAPAPGRVHRGGDSDVSHPPARTRTVWCHGGGL